MSTALFVIFLTFLDFGGGEVMVITSQLLPAAVLHSRFRSRNTRFEAFVERRCRKFCKAAGHTTGGDSKRETERDTEEGRKQ